ncbi:Bifunctional NAD(P)H-hydrate repair enzyme Nnr [Dyadobacter sp. CECT 9275]|uniref:Bifunctional NAD(P)H-hydrate repair enzyme n=1 Tax=Dyadobacter helix TaxID=2822344 RepID=A0A916JA62_9BACT|nr:NAD(P)H-hydrate dehydratase [Dyadobacter sp. CECT 9275]CAG4993873.1 Bifunctional NAD(P)H-hydrate repair enzyme Nnr [Dyadobacter sp. CECT 9275]
MKILNVGQIRDLDAFTIENEPVSSVNLMERAAQAFCWWFCNQFVNTRPVTVFCGQGNNGGDGLAIARILSQKCYDVRVYIIEHTANTSADFSENLKRLSDHLTPFQIRKETDLPDLSEKTICIDALLGSGLSRPAEGIMAKVIGLLNTSRNKVVSVDIASGLFIDKSNQETDPIIQPLFTITFQLPKLAFFMPQNAVFVGEWRIVDIGLDTVHLLQQHTPYYYTDSAHAESIIRPRNKFSHKGTFGHALIIAGSYGKIGAAILAGKACLRSGVGLLTLHIPECGYEIAQISLPEAMVSVDVDRKFNTALGSVSSYSSIGIGPGLGQEDATAQMLAKLLTEARLPLVIDADALNIISQHNDLLDKIPAKSILTPHPKEFQRLAGETANDFDRLETGRKFAQKYNIIICLKGAHTAVILPNGDVHFNSTGNAGMATGGTGDVLTGIITSLLAQGYPPEHAAILGVYEHGLAGDRAASRKGQSAMIASDVIENLKID